MQPPDPDHAGSFCAGSDLGRAPRPRELVAFPPFIRVNWKLNMDTGWIDDLSDETEAATISVTAVVEGLSYYLRLALRPETVKELRLVAREYTNRLELLHALSRSLSETKAAIESLVADGHPREPNPELTPQVIDIIDDHERKEAAARAMSRARFLRLRSLIARPQHNGRDHRETHRNHHRATRGPPDQRGHGLAARFRVRRRGARRRDRGIHCPGIDARPRRAGLSAAACRGRQDFLQRSRDSSSLADPGRCVASGAEFDGPADRCHSGQTAGRAKPCHEVRPCLEARSRTVKIRHPEPSSSLAHRLRRGQDRRHGQKP
jgi:hypothetical protein